MLLETGQNYIKIEVEKGLFLLFGSRKSEVLIWIGLCAESQFIFLLSLHGIPTMIQQLCSSSFNHLVSNLRIASSTTKTGTHFQNHSLFCEWLTDGPR